MQVSKKLNLGFDALGGNASKECKFESQSVAISKFKIKVKSKKPLLEFPEEALAVMLVFNN